MLHFLDVYTVYLTTKCATGTTAVGDARWRSDNMGILNVIESAMQNKRLIFGMDPGLTHFKVLSTFCTRLHIQDSTLRLPWSVIGAVHICWRCCETAQRQSSWLDFANIGIKDNDWLFPLPLVWFIQSFYRILPSVAHNPAHLCLFSAVQS